MDVGEKTKSRIEKGWFICSGCQVGFSWQTLDDHTASVDTYSYSLTQRCEHGL